jgi:hypothetical protein
LLLGNSLLLINPFWLDEHLDWSLDYEEQVFSFVSLSEYLIFWQKDNAP